MQQFNNLTGNVIVHPKKNNEIILQVEYKGGTWLDIPVTQEKFDELVERKVLLYN